MKLLDRVSRSNRSLRLSIALAMVAIATLSGFDASAQTVDISTAPLYAGATTSPNVVISASFEFPTAGQAYLCSSANSSSTACAGYNGSTGASIYSASNTYTGYFDPTKCYTYSGDNTIEDPNGYFYVPTGATGVADSRSCGASLFSGNALNWATMSALDEFRYALTGGNRDKETGTGAQSPNGGTILQRAYLSGCSATTSSNSNCSDVNYAPTSVAGVPDFYSSNGLYPTLQTTFLGANVIVNNCKTFMYLASSDGSGNCTFPRKDKGVYNVRVSVCDSNEGPTRTDLCLQYGGSSGKYKPVGTVQRNAAKMRFAIFGYLLDRTVSGYTVPSSCTDNLTNTPNNWNRCRVGGVLRAPMKYLGPTKYDASGAASPNVNAEINADGTLVDDPEGNAASFGGKYSGFINYLNRFGSVVQANPPSGSLGGAGEYKRYDTMGEMYYEAIRYYQNLPPTPETYQGNYPNQVAGYFPVLSGANWPADPIAAQCASNYIISIADTDTWDDVYLPGYAGSPYLNPSWQYNSGKVFRATSRAKDSSSTLDAYEWTRKIGALEASTNSLTSNDVRPQIYNSNQFPNPISATQLQDALTGSATTATYFAAGAAYWANTNDIRPDLPALGNNKIHSIKTISVDTGGQDRPVWDRQLYLMGKYGGFTVPTISRSDGTQNNPFYATNAANPTGPGIRSNSEWEDAPGSGYPANYLRASTPQKLITGLQSAFANIAANSGTAAGASVTSANLTYGASAAYISQFSPTRWSGTVLAETLSSVNGVFTVGTTPIWDAGALLTTRCGSSAPYSSICTDASLTTVGNRNIVTTITSSGVRSAVNFTYANLSADANYKAALDVNPATGSSDSLGPQRVNYLRGYRADETSTAAFRVRDSVMGDIINSAPVYVGAPGTGITDAAYPAFYTANANRTAAVYAGANDGMLHAFNAATGAELFAYIPGILSSYLSDLTNPAYSHDPFVDAIPTIQEAKVNGSFKTVLVSGVGGGAQGVYALDVTDPGAFDPTKVLFEFSDADDYDFGNVLFAPQIVKLQTGTTTSGSTTSPTYGYFAAVTSYNSRRPLCRSPGNSKLLLTLSNGNTGFYSSIPTCTNNSQGDTYVISDSANRGALYLLSLDRTVGTPWVQNSNYYKFYFPAASTTTRNGLGPVSALPSGTGDGSASALYFGDLQGQLWRLNTVGAPSGWVPSRGTSSNPLPVFNAVDASNNRQPITARPELATGPYGSTLVIFGTGAYVGQTDLTTPYAQQSEYVLIDTNGSTLISRSSDLQPRNASVSNGQVTVSGTAFTYNGTSSKRGWYIDFPSTSSGERMVNKAAVAPGLLTFTSLTLAGSVCGAGGGYVYQVNPLSGLPLSGTTGGYTSTVGIPGPPVIVDLTLTAGQSRPTGEQINQKTRTTLVSGTSGAIAGIGTPPATKVPPVGRVSWREITNYNDQPRTP